MRFSLEALVLFVGALGVAAQAAPQTGAAAAATPSPTPSPSPSPTPSPGGSKLLPYWYEAERPRTAGPLLRFEDQAEVRALEMNAAIARFFDNSDDNGDMTRGATPGGAPTLAEMKNYRPHMSPSIDFLSLAAWAAKEIKNGVSRRYKSRVERNEEVLRALLLGEFPTPSPTPSSSPSPSPSPVS